YLSALAFLPSAEIPSAFDHIKAILSPSTNSIVKYFEETYICERLVEAGRAHVGVYTIIKEMYKKQNKTKLQIESLLCEESEPSQSKHSIDNEKQILTF
ncbi:5028_t:CDS:2, partial [Dentiscutata heterogama]